MNETEMAKIEILMWMFNNLNASQLLRLKAIAIDIKRNSETLTQKNKTNEHPKV